MNSALLTQAKELPLKERVELIDELWTTIVDEGYAPPMTPEQAAELDRRMEEHRRNSDAVISWKQMRAKLRAKYGWKD
jgi:putative addiction module component (TIGR02574 family)